MNRSSLFIFCFYLWCCSISHSSNNTNHRISLSVQSSTTMSISPSPDFNLAESTSNDVTTTQIDLYTTSQAPKVTLNISNENLQKTGIHFKGNGSQPMMLLSSKGKDYTLNRKNLSNPLGFKLISPSVHQSSAPIPITITLIDMD